MNILLVNPPLREWAPARYHPFGLASLAAMLQQDGHHVEILDVNRHRCKWEETPFPPGPWDWVGVGGLITTYKWLTVTMPMMRKLYSCPIVIGGGGASSAPEVYLENLRPDIVGIGEGEYTVLDLCKYFAGDMRREDVKGIAYLEDGKAKFTDPRPIEWDIDKFPRQAYDLLDIKAYVGGGVAYAIKDIVARGDTVAFRKGKFELGILATRGCPRHCTFCYKIFGRGVRIRDPLRVVDEIQFLAEKYEPEVFGFNDECMTASRKFVWEFCEEVLRRGMKIHWTCQTRADALDEETMALMAKAGCFRVALGMESGSQRILDEMDKRTTPAKLRDAYILAKRHFQTVSTTWIFGMPGEDDESIAENVAFVKSLGLYTRFYHLQPYPGTKIFEDNKDRILAKFGSLHNFFQELHDNSNFIINLTKWPDDVYAAKKFAMQQRIKKPMIEAQIRHEFEADMRLECGLMGDNECKFAPLMEKEAGQ